MCMKTEPNLKVNGANYTAHSESTARKSIFYSSYSDEAIIFQIFFEEKEKNAQFIHFLLSFQSVKVSKDVKSKHIFSERQKIVVILTKWQSKYKNNQLILVFILLIHSICTTFQCTYNLLKICNSVMNWYNNLMLKSPRQKVKEMQTQLVFKRV